MSCCRYDCTEIAKALHNADIVTVGDLLMVAPRRYYHWGRLTPLSSLREGEDVTILAESPERTWSPTEAAQEYASR